MSVTGFLATLVKSLFVASGGETALRVVGSVSEGSTPSGQYEDLLKGSLTTGADGNTALYVLSSTE